MATAYKTPLTLKTVPVPMPMPGYVISAQTYSKSLDVPVDEMCNGWTVINKGTAGTAIRVNGVPLNAPPAAGQSGESLSSGGNLGELYRGRLSIAVEAADTAPEFVVIQKIYL
jgi:hypothetical protein